jgi:hypothetical protein
VVRGGTHGRDNDQQQYLLSRPLLMLDDKGEEEGLKIHLSSCPVCLLVTGLTDAC